MSYILDALKKSEKERQRGKIPSFDSQQDMEPPRLSKKKKRWPYWLIGAMFINAAVLLWWGKPWQKSEDELSETIHEKAVSHIPSPSAQNSVSAPDVNAVHTPSQKAVPETPPIAGADQRNSFRRQNDTASVAPSAPQPPAMVTESSGNMEIKTDQKAAVEKGEVTLRDEVERENIGETDDSLQGGLPQLDTDDYDLAEEEALSPVEAQTEENVPPDNRELSRRRPARTTDANEDRARTAEAVPDFSQLPSSVLERLPEITISLHLYSKLPQRRKVSVNGRMVGEKDRIGHLVVEEITTDGVIFNFEGIRFRKQVFR